MSGEESLAQVYREIEHPKLRNLKKAGFVIFIYSLIFTAGVSFLAVMIIPDDTRKNFLDNLIGGLRVVPFRVEGLAGWQFLRTNPEGVQCCDCGRDQPPVV